MTLELGEDVVIHPSARINCGTCVIGDRSIIRDEVIIEGTYVGIGRESFINTRAHIGGGSCTDPGSRLLAGDFLHMGVDSHINTARMVDIGDEVGIGIGTKIFTHGAYLSCLDGFPVQWGDVKIGNRVWLPHAWVNPGAIIGDDVVVAAMSLIASGMCIPSGSLAGGIPAKVLHENIYPREPLEPWIHISQIINDTYNIIDDPLLLMREHSNVIWIQTPPDKAIDRTYFDVKNRTIRGPVTKWTRVFKSQLRRNGIRFRYKEEDSRYVPW